jgi:hypothetical protein
MPIAGCGIIAIVGAPIDIPGAMGIIGAAMGIIGAAIGIMGIMPPAGAGIVVVISVGCGIATGRMNGIGSGKVSNMKPILHFPCLILVVIMGTDPWAYSGAGAAG